MREGASDYGLDPAGLSLVLEKYASNGFGYASYPVTVPAVGENYAISLTSPCWGYGQIEKMPGMQLLNYTEKRWDDHQDVVALFRVE